MKIYIAGPMSGLPEFNFPSFNLAASILRKEGHEVFNPAERDLELDRDFQKNNPEGDIKKAEANGFSLRDAMKDDLTWICDNAEGIFMLKGWESSSGARTEWQLAQCLRIPTFYQDWD